MKLLKIFPMILVVSGCTKDILDTAFTTEVCIKPYKNYYYHTCHDIKFSVDGKQFIIPKGFKTDLASFPKIAWPIMAPAHSSLIRPAIVHDWFYRKTCDFTRIQADLIFYHMLKNDGITNLRASLMYYAVRWFGYKYYNEDYCDD